MNSHQTASQTSSPPWRRGFAVRFAFAVIVLNHIAGYLLLYRAFPGLPRETAHKTVAGLYWLEIWLMATGFILEHFPDLSLVAACLGPVTLILMVPRPLLTSILCGFVALGAYVLMLEHTDSAGLYRILETLSIFAAYDFMSSGVIMGKTVSVTFREDHPLLKPEAIIASIFLGAIESVCNMRLRVMHALEMSIQDPDMWPSIKQD